jgi:hypothetical protein
MESKDQRVQRTIAGSGKAQKVAIVACMRKLQTMQNALLGRKCANRFVNPNS